MLDGIGIYGMVWHYALLIAMLGSTLLVLLYAWSKGRLDFDDQASVQMMQEEEISKEDRNG
jgi:uncharacterized membrane protein